MKADLGLLVLRLTSGLLMASHGWSKAARLAGGDTKFADPLGIGQLPSLILVIFAELLCALAVAAGLWTRVAAIPVVIAMAVAGFVQLRHAPLGDRELALVYCAVFLALALLGGGRYSLENAWTKMRRGKGK